MGVGYGFPSDCQVMQQGSTGELTAHGVNFDLWETGDRGEPAGKSPLHSSLPWTVLRHYFFCA